MIDKAIRYQKGLKVSDFVEFDGKTCACGCGVLLEGKKVKWATRECNNRIYKEISIIKGDVGTIRKELFRMDKGACRICGEITDDWQADHIVPVKQGGGACSIDNFQTLCRECHKEKTRDQTLSHRSKISLHALFKFSSVLLYAEGDVA